MNERKRKAPNEIMRSLRMCTVGGDCKACAYYDNEDGFDCSDTMRRDAIDCIRDLMRQCNQHGMKTEEYQKRVERQCEPGEFDTRLQIAAFNLYSADDACRALIRGYLYQGKTLERMQLGDVLGDMYGYLTEMVSVLGLSLNDVMRCSLIRRKRIRETMDGMAELARAFTAKPGKTAETTEEIHDVGTTEDRIAKASATGIPHGGLCYLYGRMSAPDGNWCEGCRWANDPGVDCHGGHRFEVKGEDK